MSTQIVRHSATRYPAFTFNKWKRNMDPEVAKVAQETANAVSAGGGGFLASVITLLGVGGAYAASLLAKKIGFFSTSAGEANQSAQKDMLDWIQGQLEAEVSRREKAETQVQSLLVKLNEVTTQMSRMEVQMARTEEQNVLLNEKVTVLTTTVTDLKAHIAGVTRT